MKKIKNCVPFGTLDSDYSDCPKTPKKQPLKATKEVTFKDFAKLMQKRRRTLEDLVGMFRGKIEDPREFFVRVLSCKYKHEDRSFSVIPYGSVIAFYYQELHYLEAGSNRLPRPVKKTGTDS